MGGQVCLGGQKAAWPALPRLVPGGSEGWEAAPPGTDERSRV